MITLPARTIVRFRFPIVILWAIAILFAIPRAVRVQEVLQVEGDAVRESESERANQLIRAAFPEPVANFFAVTLDAPIPIDRPESQRILEQLTRTAAAEPYITRVVSYLTTEDSSFVSRDRRTTFFLAVLDVAEDDRSTELVPAFRDAIHTTVQRTPGTDGYRVHVTGGPALDYDIRTVSKEDTRTGEERSLPVTGIILILAFGALVAAVLPLVVGIFAITVSLGLVEIAANVHPMSVFVVTIVSMVGLGVGIDYSLLAVTRFREELHRGRSKREAAERTISTAGRAVVTSGLTVAVGFASLLITPITETRSVGIGGLLVVSVAVLLTVTLLPAVLSVLGSAIDHPKWLARRLRWYHAPSGWERWSRWLAVHPWRAMLIGGFAIALITWPLAQIKLGLPRSNWFPANTESSEGVKSLERIGSRGALQPIRVVLRAEEGQRIVGTRHVRGLIRLSDSIGADPHVAQVRSVVDIDPNRSSLGYTIYYSNMERARSRSPEFYSAYLSADDRTTLMDVILADSTSYTSSMDVVRRIRGLVKDGVRGLTDVEVVLGGFAASSVDLQDTLIEQFPLVIALVLVTTALMLFIAFRSILVPLKAVVMNCLSVAGAFGATVLVFQNGVGATLLGLDGPTEAVYAVIPVLVFAIVFGLSMDYEVFLLSRIKEAFDRSGRNDQATMEGLTATASVITSAAAIMIVVFGVFAFSRVLPAKLLGFGLAVAVFLDATIIRMVLVPAFMHVAGRWNWWPGVRKPSRERPVSTRREGRPSGSPAPEKAP